MSGRNYQRELDTMIGRFDGRIPTLLLHACCAPCSSYVLEYLSKYFAITVFYYNPNIEPEEEYDTRASELLRLIGEMDFQNPVRLIRGLYEPEKFHAFADDLADEREGGGRCEQCFRLRLYEAAREAQRQGCTYFATTLSISPRKNAEKLNAVGEAVAKETGVLYLPSDFKKRGGFLRSVELSNEHHLYRQDYCGCIYSKRRDALGSAMGGTLHQTDG